MSELPTRDEFAAQEGTKFQLYLNPEENIVVESKPETTIGLELIEITEVKKTPAVESFSLAFLAAGDVSLAPLTYKLKHEELGEMELFLSPYAKDEAGLKLEAVFSHLVKSD